MLLRNGPLLPFIPPLLTTLSFSFLLFILPSLFFFHPGFIFPALSFFLFSASWSAFIVSFSSSTLVLHIFFFKVFFLLPATLSCYPHFFLFFPHLFFSPYYFYSRFLFSPFFLFLSFSMTITFLNFPFLNTHTVLYVPCSFHLSIFFLSLSFSISLSRHFSNKNKIWTLWTAHQYKLLSPVLASSDFIKMSSTFSKLHRVSLLCLYVAFSVILIIF